MQLIQRKKQLQFACLLWAFVLALLALQPSRNMRFFLRTEILNFLAHMAAYGAMAFLLVLYLRFKRHLLGISLNRWQMAVLAIGITCLWGGLTELLQAFTPDRRVDFWDWFYDSLGAVGGVGLFYLLRRWL